MMLMKPEIKFNIISHCAFSPTDLRFHAYFWPFYYSPQTLKGQSKSFHAMKDFFRGGFLLQKLNTILNE